MCAATTLAARRRIHHRLAEALVHGIDQQPRPPIGHLEAARAGEHYIGSIPALILVYFVLNTGLTAVAVALEAGTSPVPVWKSHALYTGANYVAAAALAGLLAAAPAEFVTTHE